MCNFIKFYGKKAKKKKEIDIFRIKGKKNLDQTLCIIRDKQEI